MEKVKSLDIRVEGRVHGVGFRAWTADAARMRGLKGWVRNARDGSVQALIAGPPGAVDDMLAELRRGPPHARVTAVRADPSDHDPPDAFEVLW